MLLNFRDYVRTVDFFYLDELLSYFFNRFKILIYEEKMMLVVFKKMLTNIRIMELLYNGIELALKEVLLINRLISSLSQVHTPMFVSVEEIYGMRNIQRVEEQSETQPTMSFTGTQGACLSQLFIGCDF
jgi:hypothetical protein